MGLYFLLVVTLFCCALASAASTAQCPTAPSSPEDRRSNKSVLKIATYNVEWLFLSRSNCPGSGCPWTTYAAAKEHMETVAEEIRIINADILNLAEVQDCGVLTELNNLLAGMDYKPYLLTGTDTATGQNMGLLTRVDPAVNLQRTSNRVSYPIAGSTCGSNSYTGTSSVSKHFYTTFNVAGLPNPLSIFGLHLLAFPDQVDRCVQREAQAKVIQALVASAIEQGHSAVVLGDLNDFDGTVPDASNNQPISSVLQILKDPLPSSGDELVNVAQFVSNRLQRYTCWYDRSGDCSVQNDELSSIDHILVTNDLAAGVSSSEMDHSYPPACTTFNSDHWPVIVTLDTDAISAAHRNHLFGAEAPSGPQVASQTNSNGNISNGSRTPPVAVFVVCAAVAAVAVAAVLAFVVIRRQRRAAIPFVTLPTSTESSQLMH